MQEMGSVTPLKCPPIWVVERRKRHHLTFIWPLERAYVSVKSSIW